MASEYTPEDPKELKEPRYFYTDYTQLLKDVEVERKIKKHSADELIARNKELERELRRKERELADEKEKVEILKKSGRRLRRLTSFMQAGE